MHETTFYLFCWVKEASLNNFISFPYRNPSSHCFCPLQIYILSIVLKTINFSYSTFSDLKVLLLFFLFHYNILQVICFEILEKSLFLFGNIVLTFEKRNAWILFFTFYHELRRNLGRGTQHLQESTTCRPSGEEAPYLHLARAT